MEVNTKTRLRKPLNQISHLALLFAPCIHLYMYTPFAMLCKQENTWWLRVILIYVVFFFIFCSLSLCIKILLLLGVSRRLIFTPAHSPIKWRAFIWFSTFYHATHTLHILGFLFALFQSICDFFLSRVFISGLWTIFLFELMSSHQM